MTEILLPSASGLTIGILAVMCWVILTVKANEARLERKIDLLLDHAKIDIATIAIQKAESLVRAGKKIEAIKAYRELTGADLAEAKAMVEKIAG